MCEANNAFKGTALHFYYDREGPYVLKQYHDLGECIFVRNHNKILAHISVSREHRFLPLSFNMKILIVAWYKN